MQKIFLGAACALTLFSCQQNDREVGKIIEKENGLKYEYITVGEGEMPTDSLRVLVTKMSVITEDDSVIYQTADMMPDLLPVSRMEDRGLFGEGAKMLRKNDSVRFYIPAKDLFLQTYRVPVPFGIDTAQDLRVTIGVQDMTNDAGAQRMVAQKNIDAQRQRFEGFNEQIEKDRALIREYLKENNLEADSTGLGIYVVKTQDAEGENAQPGENINVKYEGRLLGETESFDAGSIPITIGMSRVVYGWTEGLQMFGKGDKGTMYIPSSLGYGEQGSGGVIPPNSILEFDIEVEE